MQTDSSAICAWRELRSAVEYTATQRMLSSLHALIIRTAISLAVLKAYEYIRKHVAEALLDILLCAAAPELIENYGVNIFSVLLHERSVALGRRSAEKLSQLASCHVHPSLLINVKIDLSYITFGAKGKSAARISKKSAAELLL